MKCVYMRVSPAMTLIDDLITLIQFCKSYWRKQGPTAWAATTHKDTQPPNYIVKKGMVPPPEMTDNS